jgi:hypothetical protein
MIKVLDYSKKNTVLSLPTDMVHKLLGLAGLKKTDILRLNYDFPQADEVKAFERARKYKKNDYISLDSFLAKYKHAGSTV